MERKIGEIFEYNGEWYKCMENTGCKLCDFCEEDGSCKMMDKDMWCNPDNRRDKTPVIFKKLEKVGEPYKSMGKCFQVYKTYCTPTNVGLGASYDGSKLTIELKQTKEDMEESVEEKLFCDKVAKANAEYMKIKLNSSLKPFDLEAAKLGKPVCTRDGRKARIICFDRISGDDYYKIVACVTAFDEDFEEVLFYGIDGYIVGSQNPKDEDLMMLPEKHEGWVNILCNDDNGIYVAVAFYFHHITPPFVFYNFGATSTVTAYTTTT